jgi:hypothetical protein
MNDDLSNDARSRWGQQERDRLARDIGPDRADEWISVLRDLATAAHGTELVTIWDAIRFALDARSDAITRDELAAVFRQGLPVNAAGNPHAAACHVFTQAARNRRDPGNAAPRGDSGPGTPDLAGLITDLALVLVDAGRRNAGLSARASGQAALLRLQSALGWTYTQDTNEITGRLAVALAKAQAQGGNTTQVQRTLSEARARWAPGSPGTAKSQADIAAIVIGEIERDLAGAQGEPASRGDSPPGSPDPRGDSDPVRQAAQRMTADVLKIIRSPGAGRLGTDDIAWMEGEIQHVAEIWIESARLDEPGEENSR